MGVLGWMRRERKGGKAAAPPLTAASPEDKREEEAPKPIGKATDESRAHVHERSHLTG